MTAVSDQPTSELRANLRAEREHAATVSGWRQKSARQRTVEIEAELEARGEPPEREPAKPQQGPQPKGYHTPQRLKMHTVDTPPDDDATLCYHEDRGDGMPLCGQPLNPWTDENGALREVEWAPHGPGVVDCGKCANNPYRDHRPEPLAEPQGDRCVPCPAAGLRRTGDVTKHHLYFEVEAAVSRRVGGERYRRKQQSARTTARPSTDGGRAFGLLR
jgi:hypothetical protein